MPQSVFSPLFFQVVLALTSLFQLTGFIWYFTRRDKFPIPVRRPFVVLAEIFFCASFGFFWLLWDAFPDLSPPCGVVLLLTYVTFAAALCLIETRIALLWSWDLLTQLCIKYDSKLDGNLLTQIDSQQMVINLPESWQKFIADHRQWINVRTVVLSVASLWFWISLIFYFIFNQWNEIAGGMIMQIPYHSDICSSLEIMEIGWGSLLIGFPAALGVCMALMTSSIEDDNFGLHNEMRGCLWAGLFLCVICALPQIPQLQTDFFQTNAYHFIAGFFGDLLVLWLTSFRVIIWTYLTDSNLHFQHVKYDFKQVTGNASGRAESALSLISNAEMREEKFIIKESPLTQVLCSKDGSRLFENFLRKEFALENILFYNACQNYKTLHLENCRLTKEETPVMRLQDLLRHAQLIKEKFIMEDSILSVNLCASSRKGILKFLEQNQTVQDLKRDTTILVNGHILQDEHEKAWEALEAMEETGSISIASFQQTVGAGNPSGGIMSNAIRKSKELLGLVKVSPSHSSKSSSVSSAHAFIQNNEYEETKASFVSDLLRDLDAAKINQLENLFNAAETEIVILMERDAFRRFLKTPEFQIFSKYGRFAEDIVVIGSNGETKESSASAAVKSRTNVISADNTSSCWRRALRRISCLPRNLEITGVVMTQEQ